MEFRKYATSNPSCRPSLATWTTRKVLLKPTSSFLLSLSLSADVRLNISTNIRTIHWRIHHSLPLSFVGETHNFCQRNSLFPTYTNITVDRKHFSSSGKLLCLAHRQKRKVKKGERKKFFYYFFLGHFLQKKQNLAFIIFCVWSTKFLHLCILVCWMGKQQEAKKNFKKDSLKKVLSRNYFHQH